MECAKDIILEIKNGRDVSKEKKEKIGFWGKIINKVARHKVMTTILLATVGFMVLDVLLISSFVNVLTVNY